MRQGGRRDGATRWWLGLALGAALASTLAACTPSQQSLPGTLPGGTYSSAAYHFRLVYPSGWVANASSCASGFGTPTSCGGAQGTVTTDQPAIPLQLSITRAGRTAATPVVSSLTLSVMDLRNPYVAQAATQLAGDTSLHATTLAGQPAYASAPMQEPVPGAGGTPSALTDTHTDYYLVHGTYEYQLSTDAVSGDGADPALAAMVRSFALTG